MPESIATDNNTAHIRNVPKWKMQILFMEMQMEKNERKKKKKVILNNVFFLSQ